MANWFENLVVGIVTGPIAAAGESKLVEVLKTLRETNVETYNAVIAGGRALVSGLQPLVDASSTKIDDAILKAISEAIEASASEITE